LNSISNLRDQRVVSANNLANMNVPGFRRDLPNEGRAFYIDSQDSLPVRAMQLEKGPHTFSQTAGFIDQTGEQMDVAIADQGFFFSQTPGGEPALTRRGDLHAGPDGTLTNGAGDAMLDDAMQPITLPPFRRMDVDDAGVVSIEPLNGAAGQMTRIAKLGTVVPTGVQLIKGPDGNIRLPDGSVPPADGRARVIQGAREGSNVNSTEELISSIDLQRSFEINLKMITTAKELDQAGTRLMRMPEN
jgi:flagellar basal-body rod protein FlgF